MARINKVDFFCGAFLTYLITNGVEPTLFEATEKSKIVQFSLRDKDYNVYLKYVSTTKQSVQAGKVYTKWDVIFTKAEKSILDKSFNEQGKENLVILVCTNESLKDTYFAILPYENAMKCLGADDINKQPRISVKRKKGSKYVAYYGTAVSDENAFQTKYNFNEYFGF